MQARIAAHAGQRRPGGFCRRDRAYRCRRFRRFYFRLENLPRPRNRIPLVIQQRLDTQRHLHIALPIQTLPGAAFIRLQLRKLRLPETQHISRNFA